MLYKCRRYEDNRDFYHFPVMDMNRNVFLTNPQKVDPADIIRMNQFWGDESWRASLIYRLLTYLVEMVELKNQTVILLSLSKKIGGCSPL
jgi:hypothetical protein